MTKDTAKNISASKEFVVHLVDENLVEQVNQAASSYPSSVSEVEETGLTLAPSKKCRFPEFKKPAFEWNVSFTKLFH